MVSPEITITPCEPSAVLHVLAAGWHRVPRGHSLQDLMARGQCFRMADVTGATVGAYVLEGKGGDLWVTAAAGRAAVDLSTVMDIATTAQGQAFDHIVFRTARRGLVKKAEARGFEVTEYIMRKAIKK